MIAKKIAKKPEIRDDYSHLGRYVAAAREKGEKLDRFWIVGCDAGTDLADLDTALIEIEATRAFNSKLTDRTYHLVVSFHAGEQDKLSLADLQDIERAFAEALGFADHQRVAGTHINTDNFHLHIAYNKIHPETHRCHTPHRDFFTLSKVARAMEQKYGLKVDRGIGAEPNPVSAKARDYEARTWQQSFERHLIDHKAEILAMIGTTNSWAEVHQGLAEYDAEIHKRGVGLVIRRIDGAGAIKASALDRSCSLKNLEQRFGPYQPPGLERDRTRAERPPRKPYLAKPLTRHPATSKLWRTWRQDKPSGFLGRHLFNLRSWRDYLMADAHKDALALAIIVTHREFLHLLIGDDPAPRHAVSRSIRPALESWLAAAPWRHPAIAGIGRGALAALGLKGDRTGRALFPLRDEDGHVWAIHAIDESGRSCTIGDATRPGLRYVLDHAGRLDATDPHAGPILLSTDAIAASLARTGTDQPAVLVGREADLPRTATALKRRHPQAAIEILTPTASPEAEAAARAVGGRVVRCDQFQSLADRVARQLSERQIVALDPDLAHAMGAFVETALTPDQAKPSSPKPSGPGRSR
ncbi:TraI/MobA(P) family conjugative relaxase [Magnetospirillum fulvum]|uniref:Relaxase/Mobilisation nuclease domain-containing protein n=1 Tax=Magnetospirillum fulvum TaxID=1082 RepID=A0A1H6JW21_MAGFU|nr:TraI/MobA(P) family conjugative relaxase [Magnetospirillum fulvum]SEH66574.1 Relaxase/Mobilisation nuclease domain-containing protein [Magnetospirillum fulvum]